MVNATHNKILNTCILYCLAEMPYGMENFARSIKGMVQHLKNGGRLSCPSAAHAPVLYVINVANNILFILVDITVTQ